VPQWEGLGTDEVRLSRKRVVLSGKANRPVLDGKAMEASSHSQDIIEGFGRTYDLLLKHRDELLAANGPLAAFVDDEVRVIMRATNDYGKLLYDGFHPDVLRNALDRERLFDRLWMDVEHQPHLAQVIAAEREDLEQGDVPIFTTHPASPDLWSGTKRRIEGFFAESGMAQVRRHLAEWGESDRSRQAWFIHASLATLLKGAAERSRVARDEAEIETPCGPAEFIAAARDIGDRLESLALRGDDEAAWIGLTLANERAWSLASLGTDLYDGMPGVALFLAYLSSITGEERYKSLAQAALSTIRRMNDASRSEKMSIGAFSGFGSVIYTLAHLGVLWNRPDLLEEGRKLVAWIPPCIAHDDCLDIIGGCAGCIACLLALDRCEHSPSTIDVARQCGERLFASARPMEQGIGWPAPALRNKALAGLSHGAAGIAWALLELAAVTGDERFRSAARDGIAYERTLFSAKHGNWRDVREDLAADAQPQQPQPPQQEDCFTIAWCHGAPGIGLARLGCLQHLDDPAIHAEIRTAIKTTADHGFRGSHCLCHGALGNLDLLLQASRQLRDEQWDAQYKRVAARVLGSGRSAGWICGNPLGVESPGLMTGLAGIGYELLRLARPDRVPCVLLLEPPVLQAGD
jgi:type 2 lantibiotic biosynthesis protein LanM